MRNWNDAASLALPSNEMIEWKRDSAKCKSNGLFGRIFEDRGEMKSQRYMVNFLLNSFHRAVRNDAKFTFRQLSCWSLYCTGSWLISSVEAMLRCSWINEKEGRLRGFGSQHIRINNVNPAGTDGGRGSLSEWVPTPYMMAAWSTSRYGVSPVSNSHSTTPYDLRFSDSFKNSLSFRCGNVSYVYQTSTFSEQSSLRMTSGAIQA